MFQWSFFWNQLKKIIKRVKKKMSLEYQQTTQSPNKSKRVIVMPPPKM